MPVNLIEKLKRRKETLEQRFDSFRESPKKSLRKNWAFFSVSLIFLLAFYIRYMPEQGMRYFQALDPYWIFRQSQHLAYEGLVPESDFMRYFPYNAPFHNFSLGVVAVPAIIFNLGGFLFFENYLEFAQFIPALMGSVAVLISYFLGKEIYDKYAGVGAAFFLATIPGVLHRNSAGFFEKEPIGVPFMMLSMYFFTRAWRRNENWAGVISGISLGIFSITWGGSQMLWLLYAGVVGLMMFVNEDIEKLVAAYTPTVVIAAAFGVIFNPSKFGLTRSYVFLNLAMLGFLWSRYLVEKLELIGEEKIPYYTPGMSFLGLLLLIISPLYSSFIASQFMGMVNKIAGTVSSGGGSGTIGGTVAENQPAGLNQLIGQLGAASSASIHQHLSSIPDILLALLSQFFTIVSNLTGAWPLGYIGIAFGGTYVSAMVLRKTGFVEETMERRSYHSLMVGVLFLWSLMFSWAFQSDILIAVAPPVIALLGGLGLLNALGYEKEVEIEYRWYQLLPVVWAASSIIGAVSRSRLIFLAAFPVAFMAGYALSRIYRTLTDLERQTHEYLAYGSLLLLADGLLIRIISSFTGDILLSGALVVAANGVLIYLLENQGAGIDSYIEGRKSVKIAVLSALLIVTAGVNISAGYVNADSLGGSPNQFWMQNLDYMRENTEEGDVIMSWWDYGYWFESIGRRAAIADGGNSQYYTSGDKINFPLAEFFTSDSPGEWEPWLEKHSVDYVVLDETMIGKYSAVSQIARRSNSDFRSMQQLSTSNNIQRSLARDSQNRTVVQFSRGNLRIYMPMNLSQEEPEITSPPTIEAGRRGAIDCVLTDEGIKEFDTERMEVSGRLFGMDQQTVQVCAAINPFHSVERSIATLRQGSPRPARAVLVPREIAEHSLVRLYLMDGAGMDGFEKVEEGSPFQYVKMWEYKGSDNE